MNQTCTRVFLWMIALVLSIAATATTAPAQLAKPVKEQPRLDFALTFAADRTNATYSSNQWLIGGSAELGMRAWHGLGIAAKVTGLTTDSIGNQGVPLNLVLATFGPRYRISRSTAAGRGISVYGEGLIGDANGFKSVFAGSAGTTDSANAFAVQTGGGFDLNLTSRMGLRVVEAHWIRTQFPNGTTNVQNHLQLGTGIILRF